MGTKVGIRHTGIEIPELLLQSKVPGFNNSNLGMKGTVQLAMVLDLLLETGLQSFQIMTGLLQRLDTGI